MSMKTLKDAIDSIYLTRGIVWYGLEHLETSVVITITLFEFAVYAFLVEQ